MFWNFLFFNLFLFVIFRLMLLLPLLHFALPWLTRFWRNMYNRIKHVRLFVNISVVLCVFALICIQIIHLLHRNNNNNKNNDISTHNSDATSTKTYLHNTLANIYKTKYAADKLKDSAPTIIGLVIILQWQRRCLVPVAVMLIRTRTRIRIKRYENLHVKSMQVTLPLRPSSVSTAAYILNNVANILFTQFVFSFQVVVNLVMCAVVGWRCRPILYKT